MVLESPKEHRQWKTVFQIHAAQKIDQRNVQKDKTT